MFGAPPAQPQQAQLPPLHAAASLGNIQGVQQAVQMGTPIDQPDANNQTALHHAAKGGHAQLCQMLAQAKANVNLQSKVGATPLVFAAQAGHAGAVRQLLDLGAQPQLQTRKGKTALAVAQEKGHAAVVGMLQGQQPAAGQGMQATAPAFGSPSPLGGGGAFGGGASGGGAAFGSPSPLGGAGAPSGAFGAGAAAKAAAFGAPAAAGGAFGATASAGALSFGSMSFGATASPAAAAPAASAFGATAPAASAFGATAPAATAFGAAPSNPFGGLFGAAPAAAPATGAAASFANPFGAAAPAAAPATTPAVTFGSAAQAPGAAAPFGTFSQPPAPAPAAPAAPAPASPGAGSASGFCASSLAASFGSALPSVAPSSPRAPAASPTAPVTPTGGGGGGLATGSSGDRGSSQHITLPEAPGDSISCLRFASGPGRGPGGAHLLAASAWDGTVRVWSVPQHGQGAPKHLVTYTHARPALCACWDSQYADVYSGGADDAVRSLNVETETLSELGRHRAPVSCVATDASEELRSIVVSASWDKSAAVWDVRTPKKVHELPLPERAYTLSLRYPDALLGTANPGELLLFDLRKMPPVPKLCHQKEELKKHPMRSACLFPAGLYAGGSGFCCGTYDGRVGVNFAPPVATPPPPQAPTEQQKKDYLLAMKQWGHDFTFKCHREVQPVPQGAPPKPSTVYAVNALAFNPKKPELLATGGADGEVWLWDIRARERKCRLVTASAACGIASLDFSSQGDLLAYSHSDDWTKGEQRYNELCSAGFRNDVKVVIHPGS